MREFLILLPTHRFSFFIRHGNIAPLALRKPTYFSFSAACQLPPFSHFSSPSFETLADLK